MRVIHSDSPTKSPGRSSDPPGPSFCHHRVVSPTKAMWLPAAMGTNPVIDEIGNHARDHAYDKCDEVCHSDFTSLPTTWSGMR